MAAANGALEVGQLLLGAGATVDVKANGGTPLIVAAIKGDLEFVRLLLGVGAKVNATKHGGTTPLILASYHGHREVVLLLLASGADIAKRDWVCSRTRLSSNSRAQRTRTSSVHSIARTRRRARSARPLEVSDGAQHETPPPSLRSHTPPSPSPRTLTLPARTTLAVGPDRGRLRQEDGAH